MIQANELRIGNWVTVYGDSEHRVHLVCKTGVQVEGQIIGGIVFDPADVHPIPLTPEILEKAGFEHHYYKADSEGQTDSEWWTIKAGKGLWGKNEITIVKFEEGLTYSCHATRAECQYVHQLQNLYHALTGEELTIEL